MTINDLMKYGFWAMAGVGVYISIAILGTSFLYYLFSPIDDSDKSRFDRSGLTIFTDYKTGLQYLSSGDCIIPRLDIDGNQIFIN